MPNNTMEIMTLKNEFTDCVLKNGRTDPDEWFNELETYKTRLGIMGSDIPDEDMIGHLIRKISSKEYDLVVAHMNYDAYEPSAGYGREPKGSDQRSLQDDEAKWSYQEGTG